MDLKLNAGHMIRFIRLQLLSNCKLVKTLVQCAILLVMAVDALLSWFHGLGASGSLDVQGVS